MKRILIIDPDFEQLGGHNITANEIIRAATMAPMVIVCSRKLPADVEIAGATIKRVLPFNSYDARTQSPSLVRRARIQLQRLLPGQPVTDVDRTGFGLELRQAFRSIGITAGDAIVVHTGAAIVLDAIMDALGSIPETDWPALHFRQLRPLENMRFERRIHAGAQPMRKLGKLFMYAETRSFACKLATLGYDLPGIEHIELSDISQPLSLRHVPGREFEVAMLGTVRIEKGHGQLVPIARAYHEIMDRKGGPQLRFLIQTGAIKNEKLYRTTLSELDEAGVTYEIFGTGSGLSGHWACLQRCHAVVMPYDAQRYTDRGSGIGIDAVAHARPLVVAGNCTLEEYVRNGNGIAAIGSRSMAEALHTIATSYSEFAGNAMELATEFRKQQSQSLLFKRLNS